MQPAILREIARKPASMASSIARQLQPIGDTGATGRTIGVRKVSNPRQTYVEVGYRGRSLGNIYMSGERISRRKRGTVKGFPWLFRRTGEQVRSAGKRELKADIGKLIGRSLRKRGYRATI
jgi:hypothetical protein